MNYHEVIKYWFEDIDQAYWFKKSETFDKELESKFSKLYLEVFKGEHSKWRRSPEGSLAEIIVLDQFSRNIFRDKPEAFQSDSMALTLSQVMIDKGFDVQLDKVKRGFVYLPFMHSESVKIHLEAIEIFKKLNNENMLQYEYKHYEIIKQFGRYPHRNITLGRKSTIEEIEFLKLEGSSF
jgi:uncharacterized protein (DUF924 family)